MDIIQTYNPANSNITDEEISEMRNLTPEQIGELARTYPNQPTGNAYLVYYDKKLPEKEQRYSLGTWANLWNLYKIGQKHIVPFSFRKKFAKPVGQAAPAPQRMVDLSNEEAANAEGLKAPVDNGGDTSPAIDSPELIDLKAQLKQAQDDQAHHMTIKSIQNKIDALTNKPAEGTAQTQNS